MVLNRDKIFAFLEKIEIFEVKVRIPKFGNQIIKLFNKNWEPTKSEIFYSQPPLSLLLKTFQIFFRDIALLISFASLNWEGVKSSSVLIELEFFSIFGDCANSSFTFSSLTLVDADPDDPVETSL